MSVYTRVERSELEAFLLHYQLGHLVQFEGITAGIENTNYFVTTSTGEYVLTLFESLTNKELPYFLDLMAHLAEHQVPSAHPLPDEQNHYLRDLKNKPAALVQRLQGKNVDVATTAQCAALGKALGHLHVVGQQFTGYRENQRGPHWWVTTRDEILGKLSPSEQTLLQKELDFQQQHRHDALPVGVIHADLFRDNALFVGDTLTGIIDFYYACNDTLLYDVAVTVNDWCCAEKGSLDDAKLDAFLGAYQTERHFTLEEKHAWPVMLRAAALRFWLSRLKDKHFPREGEMTHIKDPNIFENILHNRININETCQLK
jgi:homoserine kinase type II